MLLLRGATSGEDVVVSHDRFQYMLLLRGATERLIAEGRVMVVSIHAPLARSNTFCTVCFVGTWVSIHAPLARSNVTQPLNQSMSGGFNTCSSCEEQRNGDSNPETKKKFQYMLLLRGATYYRRFCSVECMFQYMLLLRGATAQGPVPLRSFQFQYMLLLRGATGSGFLRTGSLAFQYMLLLRGATWFL